MRRDLGNEIVLENAGGCIDIIDRAAIDSDGSEKARVLPGSSEIVANFSIGKEYGRAAIAAFNAAVEVVPLVDPANGGIGLLHFINLREALTALDLA